MSEVKAVIFDRDGTINVDKGYVYKPEDLVFIKNIPQLIKKYNDLDIKVIVITNQSGVARGYYTENDVREFHKFMNQRLMDEYSAHIDAFYYCPHHPEFTGECDCRKPKIGLYMKAFFDFNLDSEDVIAYGDSKRDEDAAIKSGIKEFIYVSEV